MDIQRELCGRNRIHVCLRLCVGVCVCMCVSAFPSRSLIKATLKSSGASAVQPLHLFFSFTLYAAPWSIILTVYTLEISLQEAYVTRNFTTPDLFRLRSDWFNVHGFHIWPVFYYFWRYPWHRVQIICLRIKIV